MPILFIFLINNPKTMLSHVWFHTSDKYTHPHTHKLSHTHILLTVRNKLISLIHTLRAILVDFLVWLRHKISQAPCLQEGTSTLAAKVTAHRLSQSLSGTRQVLWTCLTTSKTYVPALRQSSMNIWICIACS